MQNSAYSQVPRPLAAPLELRLEGVELVVAHRRLFRVPLAEIEAVRLSFAPSNLFSRIFRCTLTTRAGRKVSFTSQTWRSLLHSASQAEAYAAFVRALCAAAVRANPDCRLVAGRRRAAWLFLVLASAAVGAGLAMTLVVVLYNASWPVALLFAAACSGLAWVMIDMVVRNRPRRFAADAPPANLLG